MPDVAIMIEGQMGLTWERWKRIARAVEDLGFDGLFRSDHFVGPEGPIEASLELWTSLTWLAAHTERIEFGPLVTPVSFRHPVFTARMGKDVDNLADGRLALGVGAGWQEREHEMFGFDLLNLEDRFDRFEEGVEVVASLLRNDSPVTFDGTYYQLDGAVLEPRPVRPDGTHLLVGGNGRHRTIPLAAQFADEWNGVYRTPEQFADLTDHLDAQLATVDRDPADVRRSVMTRVVFGRDEAELADQLADDDPGDLRSLGHVVGTGSEIAAQLEQFDAAGADRVMLQWLDLDRIDALADLADAIL